MQTLILKKTPLYTLFVFECFLRAKIDRAKFSVFPEITKVHDLVPVRLSVSIGVRSRFIGFALPMAVCVRLHLQPDL